MGGLRDDVPARPVRLAVVAGLLLLAAAAFLLRVVSVAEPLGIDQSFWASAVRGMARGQVLYVDVWEQRPPGIYWTYLAAFSVLGWTASAVAWLDILASATTALLLFVVARALSGLTTAAVAAALYAVFTMPAWLYGHGGFLERSVCETFIVVCVALAAWCAVAMRGRPRIVSAFGIGLFAGAAVIFKPNAGVYLPALLLWAALYRRTAGDFRWPSTWRLVLVACLAATIVPLASVAWLWRLDALQEAKVAVVDFNRFYVGQGFTLGGMVLAFAKAVWLRVKTDPLWLAGAIGAGVAAWSLIRRGRLPPLAGLALLWGGAAALAVFVNGIRLFNSYFINALPPLALLSAWLLTGDAHQGRARRGIAIVTACLMLIPLVQRNYAGRVLGLIRADLAMLTGQTDRHAYLEGFGGYDNGRGYSARANEELAAYVRRHTAPDEKIFLFGISGAGVYFASDRLPAHRFLRVNFFVPTEFPDARFDLSVVAAELAIRRPRYLIFERLHSASEMARAVDRLTDHPDVEQLLQNYRLDARLEDFTLYRRVD